MSEDTAKEPARPAAPQLYCPYCEPHIPQNWAMSGLMAMGSGYQRPPRPIAKTCSRCSDLIAHGKTGGDR